MILQGFQFLLRGGWIMWPLFTCAIIAVAVMIERNWVLRRQEREAETVAEKVNRLLEERKPDDALTEARRYNGAIAHVLAAGIANRLRGATAIEQAMQAAALRQLRVLNERLGWLDTIITMAPLLGLLGTITGMISAFKVVATASGSSAAPAITGGVAEALIATATGLAIAVSTLPVYNSLSEKVKELTNTMEATATEAQSLLSAMDHQEATASGHSPNIIIANSLSRDQEKARATATTAL